jgi:hypothetical protein
MFSFLFRFRSNIKIESLLDDDKGGLYPTPIRSEKSHLGTQASMTKYMM